MLLTNLFYIQSEIKPPKKAKAVKNDFFLAKQERATRPETGLSLGAEAIAHVLFCSQKQQKHPVPYVYRTPTLLIISVAHEVLSV